MAGVINTGSHPKLLWPGIREIWGQVYDAHAPEYPDLYNMQTSDRAYEQDVQITGFGLAPVKGQGAPVSYDSESQGWITTYAHIAYGLGFIVTYEELQDNLYREVASRRARANAFSCQQTVENVAAFLYNDAFDGNYYKTPDGQPLVSKTHSNTTGGTFANRPNTDADLSEASIEDMLKLLMTAKQDRGLNISVMARSLHVHPNDWFNANRILQSTLQPGSKNNDINVIRATNALPEGIKVNHYFTDDDAWFIRTNIPNGMTFFWRTQPQFAQDNDFDTKNAKAATYMRFSVGCTDPRGIYGNPGA